ncbi:hypothetical protein ACNKHM_19810 [Shigella sonnei]
MSSDKELCSAAVRRFPWRRQLTDSLTAQENCRVWDVEGRRLDFAGRLRCSMPGASIRKWLRRWKPNEKTVAHLLPGAHSPAVF